MKLLSNVGKKSKGSLKSSISRRMNIWNRLSNLKKSPRITNRKLSNTRKRLKQGVKNWMSLIKNIRMNLRNLKMSKRGLNRARNK